MWRDSVVLLKRGFVILAKSLWPWLDNKYLLLHSASIQYINPSSILISEGSSQMQQSNQTCVSLCLPLYLRLLPPDTSFSSHTLLSLLCVMLQASTASTLWCRIWLWQRAGRQTWPAVWSIMTTPPSSGQTQHSRPCFLGTRKVSWRMTDRSTAAAADTRQAQSQRVLSVFGFWWLRKCSSYLEKPPQYSLSLQLASTSVVS